MATRYSVSSAFGTGDHFLVYDTSEGDWREFSLSTLVTYLESNLTKVSALTKQNSVPTATGFSVTIDAGNTWLCLTPTAGFADGTVVLPTGVNDELVTITCSQVVTTFTLDSGTSSVLGAPTALTANIFFTLRYDSVSDVWYRIG